MTIWRKYSSRKASPFFCFWHICQGMQLLKMVSGLRLNQLRDYLIESLLQKLHFQTCLFICKCRDKPTNAWCLLLVRSGASTLVCLSVAEGPEAHGATDWMLNCKVSFLFFWDVECDVFMTTCGSSHMETIVHRKLLEQFWRPFLI